MAGSTVNKSLMPVWMRGRFGTLTVIGASLASGACARGGSLGSAAPTYEVYASAMLPSNASRLPRSWREPTPAVGRTSR
jgi:hypothetical protein